MISDEMLNKFIENPSDYGPTVIAMAKELQAYRKALNEPVAWIVMAPQGDYIERNPDVVAHLEGTGLAKCKPLYLRL